MDSLHIRKPSVVESAARRSWWRQSLPNPLQSLVQRRLALVAFLIGGATAFLTLLGFVLTAGLTEAAMAKHPLAAMRPVTLGVALFSLAFGLFLRKVALRPATAAQLVVAYEGLVGLAVGLGRHSVPVPDAPIPHGISALGVLILLMPLVVPMTGRRALAGGLLAALMEAAAFAIHAAQGMPLPEWPVIQQLLLPNFVLAGLAVIPAQIVFNLGRDVSRAREMGSYRLTEKLDQGGMGEVWRASHRTLARPAAIKLIRADILSTDPTRAAGMMGRFEREAQATANLQSPHSIQVFDFGTTTSGDFYYVMELLDGFDLETLVERFGPISAGRAAFLLAQACDSLVDAHGRGLIHRDIKPANIYACRYGHRFDYVKVLDFGLVKSLGTEGGRSDLTIEGTIAGTPAYMAPEAAEAPESIDDRADLYAIGCVGYWLVTGRLVFEADNPLKMVLKHVQEPPIAPSAVTELEIPPAFEDVVMRCLAKSPDERPQSAAELHDRFLDIARAEGWDYRRAQRWWDRNAPAGLQSELGRLRAPAAVELTSASLLEPDRT